MKKLFCLMLALILMLAVFPATAEEAAAVREPSDSPNVYFGGDRTQAVEMFNHYWKQAFSYSDTPVWEERTLADGSKVNIMDLEAVPGDTEMQVPTTVRFYFIDGKLAAAVQEFSAPEGIDMTRFIESTNHAMGNTPGPLDLEKARNAAELLGEDAHLKNGQNAWTYNVYATTDLNMEGGRPVISAVITMNETDGRWYVAEFPYGTAAGNAAPKELAETEGYDKLTAEEKNAVQLYAEFLQKQQKDALAQFVQFLLQKHP